jgi:hypothetical protein
MVGIGQTGAQKVPAFYQQEWYGGIKGLAPN